MKVFVERTNQEKEIEFEGTVNELLHKLNINPETVIVSDNSGLLLGSDMIKNNTQIKIHSIISGG